LEPRALPVEAFEREDPDVIVIEGQDALSRPAERLVEMVTSAFPELEEAPIAV
jgi:uncharacterized NAD-dependent epimerase/dehydratase family protein